jgi:hypothetical protein
MGTKAGAEKARARRAMLAAERERQGAIVAPAVAVIEQPAQQLSVLTAVDGAALISADAPPDADVPDVLVARQMLRAGASMAADVLNRFVAGKIKAPAAVRANAAIRTLEMAGVPVDQKRLGGRYGDLEAGGAAARLLDALARVKELRDRKATAETAAPIAAGAIEPAA